MAPSRGRRLCYFIHYFCVSLLLWCSPWLCKYLRTPGITWRLVDHVHGDGESVILAVRLPAHGDEVVITETNPRYLEQHRECTSRGTKGHRDTGTQGQGQRDTVTGSRCDAPDSICPAHHPANVRHNTPATPATPAQCRHLSLQGYRKKDRRRKGDKDGRSCRGRADEGQRGQLTCATCHQCP
ncbi:uncharacterized protein LOC135094481 isoform X2 [Scylla paramamosain]|uniref:uncharacterized protein LOC135094481 isoform X2 n=1 Tax=Scylla paramamosain TaxID=85552 RepID=UPI0030830A38